MYVYTDRKAGIILMISINLVAIRPINTDYCNGRVYLRGAYSSVAFLRVMSLFQK